MFKLAKKLYRRLFGEKFFNRILIVYIMIVIVILSLFTFFVYQNTGTILRGKQTNENNQVISAVKEYFENEADSFGRVLRKIYNDNRLYERIFELLESREDDIYEENPFRKQEIVDLFNSITDSESDICDLILYKELRQAVYIYNKKYNTFYQDNSFANKYFPLDKGLSEKAYSPSAYRSNEMNSDFPAFGIVSNVIARGASKTAGKLMVSISTAGLQKVCIENSSHLKGAILILSLDGNVIFDSSGKYYGEKYPFFNDITKGGSLPVKLETESYVNIVRSDEYKVFYACIIPKSAIDAEENATRLTIFLLSALCILLVIILYYFTTRIMSKRIRTIVCVMKKVGENDLKVRIPEKGENDEIGVISRVFNGMCDNLQENINRNYAYEISQRLMEIKMLQAQINPHFLYNTLESIRMMALEDGNEDVSELIYALSEMFRSSVRKDVIISVGEEMEFCRMYLQLFDMRFGSNLKYFFDISEEAAGYGILKYLVLPVVENYIVHGFDRDRADNRIRVKCDKQEGFIVIAVTDNGAGMDTEKLSAIYDDLHNAKGGASGMGLKNINDRIRAFFGTGYGLEIESGQEGTTVSIRIPPKTIEEMKELMGKVKEI